MTNYNTLSNNLKRDLLNFSGKISKNLTKPTQKFISDMIFGIISSKNCKLTKIGCALKEDIALKKTVERLGRNLSAFSNEETLMDNYIDTVKKYISDETLQKQQSACV